MKSTLPLLFCFVLSLCAPLQAQDAPAAPAAAEKIRSAKLFALHLTQSVGSERDFDRALIALAAWEGDKALEVSGRELALALRWAGPGAARPLRPLLRGASRVRLSGGRVQIERGRPRFVVGGRRGEPWLRVGLIVRYEVRFKGDQAAQIRGPKGLSLVPYGQTEGRRRPYRVVLEGPRPGISDALSAKKASRPATQRETRTGPNDGKAQAARAAKADELARIKAAARAAKASKRQEEETAQKRPVR